MKRVEFVTSHTTSPSSLVTVSVSVGNAQIGSSVVWLQRKELGRGSPIVALPVGKGSQIKGKRMYIKTVATDTNDKSNDLDVSYEIKGGPQDQAFTLQCTVDDQGDSAIFWCKVDFV